MVLNIPDSGLLLESSAKAMAGLPMQAFAITLSDSVIENMIECVQNGQDIQLSLGNAPAFLFDNHEVRIPTLPDPFDYDLYSSSGTPTVVHKLQHPAMSIFTAPKYKPKAPKTAPTKAAKAPVSRAVTGKPGSSTPKLAAVSDKDFSSAEDEAKSKAIENLKNSFARKEADKRENSVKLVEGIPSKGAKGKPGKVKLLGPQTNAGARSHPGSPAFGALASPLLGPTSTPAQDRVKQQRFPIIHELAVQDLSYVDLSSKYAEGTDQEFNVALRKVADFDEDLQKWVLKKLYWRELDVFQYNYAREEDRQKAIDNAIKQYDRMRLGASDPLWQKLLPKADQNKGLCLSKLQMAIANKVSAPPKINVQKAETSSASGGDSERDDSTNSTAKKGKGGEPMSRSNSQPKKKPQDTQAKRLLSNPKKTTPAASKASPRVSPTKSTATSKAPATKTGRVLSKEFITDSDSEDEAPPPSSLPKSKSATAPVPKSAERPAEKAKAVEKKEPSVAKPKAGSTKPAPKEKEREKEKDTIRAQVMAKPTKPAMKRSRDGDEDDSSSSGTPLSKRIKPAAKTQVAAVSSMKQRASSDASQNSRGANSAISAGKSKTTSPIKSSPLASSPPTNASDLDHDRSSIARDHNRARERERDRDGERDRERGRERDTIISRAGSSTASSAGGMASSGSSKKRSAEDSSPEGSTKRQRLTPEVMNKAHKFKQFYTRYEALHKEIRALDNPHPDQMADLVDMHERLQKMKTEIYREVPITDY